MTVTAESLRAELAEAEMIDMVPRFNAWLARGDGIAVYENQDLGHYQLGHRYYLSYGSPAAQLEVAEPPTRMPDFPGQIGWRYLLVGTYRGEAL